MRYCFIINPTAKSGNGKKSWIFLESIIKSKNIEFDVTYSEYKTHAIELAQIATKKYYDVVVAVGGDGTINEILRGIMNASPHVAQLPKLGIIYTGTSPDICKFHKIPITPEESINTLLNDKFEYVDIGMIEHSTNKKHSLKSYFLCSVNLGIGAAVADGSNTGLRKYLGDFFGTLISIIKSFLFFEKADFPCLIDEKKEVIKKAINITIGKNPHIASGLKVDINITPTDGLMYLCAITQFGPLSFLMNLPKLYTGKFIHHKYNFCRLIKSFECQHVPTSPNVEYDGDPQGILPCKIKLLENAIRIIK